MQTQPECMLLEREARSTAANSMGIIRECRTSWEPLPGQWQELKGNKLKECWKGIRKGCLWCQWWKWIWTAYPVRLPALQGSTPHYLLLQVWVALTPSCPHPFESCDSLTPQNLHPCPVPVTLIKVCCCFTSDTNYLCPPLKLWP